MKEPPEACFKYRSDQHLVVTLTDVALVMEALLLCEIIVRQGLLNLLHVFH